jgi:hypothetical protein
MGIKSSIITMNFNVFVNIKKTNLLMSNNFLIEEFENYKVLLFSHNTKPNIHKSIELDVSEGKAILRFVSGELPENSTEKLGSKTIFYVYYENEMYKDVIDILRNEKPLYFYYNNVNHESYITTEDEPVGENEI